MHHFFGILLPDSFPLPELDSTFLHPLRLPPPDYFHQSHPCPRSTPPRAVRQFSPRKPAQMPSFFRQFHRPSLANSLHRPQSMPLAALDEFAAIPRAVRAKTTPLSPPANRRSCYRSRLCIPSPQPRGVPDETSRPSPAAVRNVRSKMRGRPF